MATETEKPTPESTGDPKATTRSEVRAKREQKREERRAAKAEKSAAKEAEKAQKADAASAAAADGSHGPGKEAKESKGGDRKASVKKALPVLKGGVDGIRTLAGQVIWIVAVACALFLAVGALCIALDANAQNPLVDFVLNAADAVSLGIFSLEDGVKTFVGVNSDVKNALVNYGLGAVVYLVLGRVLDRVIRP